MSRVALIVPCWNLGHFLGSALASAAAQSLRPDHIVVVDDGSTDNSVEIAGGFSGVSVVRQPHRGVAAARNRGLAGIDADFVAFLDADDLWPPTSLAARLAALNESGADGCFGVIESFGSRRCGGPLPDRQHARSLGAALIRREAFDRVGMFDESLSIGEDVDWVARFDAAGLRWCTVEDVVMLRRFHDANTTADTAAVQRELLKVLRRARRASRHAG